MNTCQARALTFGDLDDPKSNVSRLIIERNGKQLQAGLGTDPSVYYVDGKHGGNDNKAPEHAMTGSHIQYLSSVEARAKELFPWLKRDNE